MMTTSKNGWLLVVAAVAMLSLAGCPSHGAQDSAKQSTPAPSMILVYRFHIPSDLAMERFSTGTSALGHDTVGERQLALADEIQEAVAKALVDRINALGLPAKLSSGTLKLNPPPDGLIVQGIFTSRDQLFPGHRNAIAYQPGQSLVSTQGTVSQLVKNKSVVVLNFTTSTQGAPMPDAMVNVKAGANNAASGGSDPAHAAVAHYAPLIDQLANTTADQASAQLGQYFVKQGWISADKVKSQPAPTL